MSDHSSKKIKNKKTVSLRRLKNWGLSLIGLLIIFLAISFTLLRTAIKSIPEYSNAIQQAVSEQMDLTLEVGFIDAEIYWLVPHLNLLDVNIYDDTGERHLVHLDEVNLSLDWAESIKNMTPIVGEITLIGLNLQIRINKKSQLLIQDYVIRDNMDATLNAAAENNIISSFELNDSIRHNLNNLDFKILNSQIHFNDDRHKNRSKTLNNFNLHLINSGSSHIFEVKADLPHKYGRYAHFIIDIEGDLSDYKNLQGELYLAVEHINAASWLDDYWSQLKVTANGDLNGQIWLAWSGQEIVDINSRLHISDLAVHYLDGKVKTWNVNGINALLRWKKTNNDWQLDIRDLIVDREGIDWLKPAAVSLKSINNKQEIELQADFLRIEGFVYLAGMIKSITEERAGWLELLEKHKPSGVLRNIDVKLPLNELKNIKINTEFSQLGFSLPGADSLEIKNLQGSVAYVNNKTWLSLNSKNTQLKFKTLFRKVIDINDLTGTMEISHESDLWNISSNSLVIDTPYIETEMRVKFRMSDGGRPFLDLTTRFKKGYAKSISDYLPVGVMGVETVAWIDRALKDGEISSGGYLFYGYLNDAPFRNNQGISLADFNVSDVDVSYLENWPAINDIEANIRFENDSMLVDAHYGKLFDSTIKDTRVYIDNFISPTLDVKGKINTQLKDIQRFVNASSLHEDITDYIDNLQFSGQGELDLELFLPLYGDYKTEVGGQLSLKNAHMRFEKEKYELEKINGLIRFAGDTVESSNLKAVVVGSPGGQLDIDIKTNRLSNTRSYLIGVKGNVLASSLMAPIPVLQTYFDGSADWDVVIDIESDDNETSVTASVVSDLQGITTSLPGPLAKKTMASSPVKIDISLKSDSNVIYDMKFENGDELSLQQLKDKLLISANTQSIKGSVKVDLQEGIDVPIKLDLEYLDINKFFSSDKKASQNTENKLTSGIEENDVSGEDVSTLSARDVPSFNFHSKKILWKKATYSDSVLNVQKSKLGAVIKDFKFVGADHVVSGKGSWFIGEGDSNITKLDINIELTDLGMVFKELEISDGLRATEGDITLRWQWQDAPYNFDWKKIEGDGRLNLKDGAFKGLNAGAGRLLGLFNFETLLSLDFGSQVKDGFNFDKIKGSFSFSDENIYSDDFTIESKVATIFMKGQLSVANNTINQTVTVRPHLGGTVTLGTAVVAGPTIGGLVYLFQKIFDTDRLSEYQYTMQGNIDNPLVKLRSAPIEEQEDDSDF